MHAVLTTLYVVVIKITIIISINNIIVIIIIIYDETIYAAMQTVKVSLAVYYCTIIYIVLKLYKV